MNKETIAKGDNIIIVDSNIPADSAFFLCSKYLIQKGYSFESRDASLGQMVTNQRSYAGGFNYKLNLVFVENEIKIRALAQVMTLGQQIVWSDWSYRKAKGDLYNDSFNKFHPDIVKMSSRLDGAKIRYIRREFSSPATSSPVSTPSKQKSLFPG
jgi:hypothetical protein